MNIRNITLTVTCPVTARASAGLRIVRKGRAGWEEWRGEGKVMRGEHWATPSSLKTPTQSYMGRMEKRVASARLHRGGVSFSEKGASYHRLSSMSWQLGSELCILSPSLKIRYNSVTPNYTQKNTKGWKRTSTITRQSRSVNNTSACWVL